MTHTRPYAYTGRADAGIPCPLSTAAFSPQTLRPTAQTSAKSAHVSMPHPTHSFPVSLVSAGFRTSTEMRVQVLPKPLRVWHFQFPNDFNLFKLSLEGKPGCVAAACYQAGFKCTDRKLAVSDEVLVRSAFHNSVGDNSPPESEVEWLMKRYQHSEAGNGVRMVTTG